MARLLAPLLLGAITPLLLAQAPAETASPQCTALEIRLELAQNRFPNVTGCRAEEAGNALRGFSYEVFTPDEEEFSETPAGEVRSQIPDAGSSPDPAVSVVLWVSIGPPPAPPVPPPAVFGVGDALAADEGEVLTFPIERRGEAQAPARLFYRLSGAATWSGPATGYIDIPADGAPPALTIQTVDGDDANAARDIRVELVEVAGGGSIDPDRRSAKGLVLDDDGAAEPPPEDPFDWWITLTLGLVALGGFALGVRAIHKWLHPPVSVAARIETGRIDIAGGDPLTDGPAFHLTVSCQAGHCGPDGPIPVLSREKVDA